MSYPAQQNQIIEQLFFVFSKADAVPILQAVSKTDLKLCRLKSDFDPAYPY